MGRQKRAYQSVTIRDVAERAGVAVSTVSRVLNGLDRVSEETRRRVEQAARELSYVPNNFAASMVTGQSKILGIIVPSFTHDFFGFIAQTAEHVFRKHGYLTIVSASGEDPVADPAAFLQRFYHMLDGVLLVPTAARLKDLESFDKPLLLVDRDMPGSSFSSISFDNEPACYELTRRLTEKGHRRIGLLVLNSPMNIGADRLAGCLRALREAGVADINFHALRHTFATNCVNLGCDAATLARILGHSDVAITLNTYVHPSFEAMRAIVDRNSESA